MVALGSPRSARLVAGVMGTGAPQRPSSPTRSPPPPKPDCDYPMDHLLFGATTRGRTQPPRTREPPEPAKPAHDESCERTLKMSLRAPRCRCQLPSLARRTRRAPSSGADVLGATRLARALGRAPHAPGGIAQRECARSIAGHVTRDEVRSRPRALDGPGQRARLQNVFIALFGLFGLVQVGPRCRRVSYRDDLRNCSHGARAVSHPMIMRRHIACDSPPRSHGFVSPAR